MTKTDKLKMCIGCRDNFYNGNNPYGVKECWALKTAKVVQRVEVSIHQVPPWKQPPSKYLSCYHSQGYCYIDPKTLNKDGYQKGW